MQIAGVVGVVIAQARCHKVKPVKQMFPLCFKKFVIAAWDVCVLFAHCQAEIHKKNIATNITAQTI